MRFLNLSDWNIACTGWSSVKESGVENVPGWYFNGDVNYCKKYRREGFFPPLLSGKLWPFSAGRRHFRLIFIAPPPHPPQTVQFINFSFRYRDISVLYGAFMFAVVLYSNISRNVIYEESLLFAGLFYVPHYKVIYCPFYFFHHQLLQS